MDLADLIQRLDVRIARAGSPGPIAGVTEDSRRVGRGWVFVARPGLHADGRRHIPEAIRAGAAAVVTDVDPEIDTGPAALLLARSPAGVGAVLAERLAGSPTSSLRLVGVTGTNGKTTVVSLVRQLVTLAGRRCGLVGTVEIDDGSGPIRSDFTTPPAERLSGLFAAMVANGCTAAAMEVSSHALHQQRVAGLSFDAAVFTNLTGDHLDYHGDMDSYADAKRLLFAQLPADGLAVVNADDPAWETMASAARARVIRCSGRDETQHACFRAGPGSGDRRGILLRGPWGSIETRTSLVGDHNAMNLLQAVTVCSESLGLGREELARAIPDLRAPTGRLEPVQGVRDEIVVLIDFAHTDDALANALRAARSVTPEGASLWAVFGCGGDKDRTKRPRMGAAAAAIADRVVVTSDNPRTESPEAIIDEVFGGIPGAALGRVARESDRRRAIAQAIGEARPGDVVVIAGKGHESEQIISDGAGGTRSVPFSDHDEARAALVRRRGHAFAGGGGSA